MHSEFEKKGTDGSVSESKEETPFEFSEKVLDRCFNPRNWGMIHNPQGFGKGNRVCGDGMEITLRIMDDTICEAKFFTEGCGPMLAAGSMVTELVVGKTVVDAFKIPRRKSMRLWMDFRKRANIARTQRQKHLKKLF